MREVVNPVGEGLVGSGGLAGLQGGLSIHGWGAGQEAKKIAQLGSRNSIASELSSG